MSSSTEAQTAESVTIADLFSKVAEVAAEEKKEMDRIMGTMLPILAWLNEPIALRPGSLGEGFGGFTSVSLQPGATVVATDLEGKALVRQLPKLRTKECLAIIREAFPELQRLVANKRRAAEIRPALSMKSVLGGSRGFIVDKRSYHLLVSNSGGDCLDLRVSLKIFGVKPKASRSFDVSRGERVDVDLGVFKEVGTMERLELLIDCKDVDGHELEGRLSVPLDGKVWGETVLTNRK